VVRRVHAARFPAGERYAMVVPAVPPFYWTGLRRLYAGRRDCVSRPPDRLFWADEQGWYLAFAEPLGWPRGQRPDYTVPVAPSEEHGVTRSTLVLAPGCKTGEMAAKRWPHFAALAERFADVAVVGTPDDLRGHDGAPLVFPAHARSLVGRLTLRQTAEALAAAGAVVANDSGLGHLAGAAGAPTLLLFGPTSERILGPFPPNVTVLRGGLPCEPCWNTARLSACGGRVDCLRALDVARVESEARALLGLTGNEGRWTNGASTDGTADSVDGTAWSGDEKSSADATGGPGDEEAPADRVVFAVDGAVDDKEWPGDEKPSADGAAGAEAEKPSVDEDSAAGTRDGLPSPTLPPRGGGAGGGGPAISITISPDPSGPAASDVEDDGDPSIPLVSCLMPTRDRRRFVAHAVEQFLRQDHPRRELVVVDDGTDAVDDLLPPDPRIRYHRVQRQRTLGGKRNLACSLARGELLAHWDDDDWMPSHRLSAQARTLAEHPAAGACGLAQLRFFDPAAGRAWEYRWPDRSRPWVAGGTLMFRRTLWEARPFPELNEGEDTRWVWALPAGTISAIPDPGLYAALVHPGNTSHKRTADPRWHPISLDLVRESMGDDWGFYAALAPAARRVTA
jgi:hypothetical protein